jgi:Flp pilus assembly pilin Flp
MAMSLQTASTPTHERRPDAKRRKVMLGTIWARLGQVYVTALTRDPLEREEGQALVEYALILALIAVVSVGALTLTSLLTLARLVSYSFAVNDVNE